MFPLYDVIVVGAGHAGCEAAAAAANLGSKTLLITMNMQTIAQMSCNPAMGGIAKGQIVREIDALGGYSGIVSDKSMIQFRMLNKSKGPAMWSPRTQNDRHLFAATWREMLENTPNLDIWQDSVCGLIVSRGTIEGVRTNLGIEIRGKSVVLTNGTFLNGVIHIGDKNFGGGRIGESKATGITEQLLELGFESDRLKTGTPPRLDGRSLDYSKMDIQDGDEDVVGFSYLGNQHPFSEEGHKESGIRGKDLGIRNKSMSTQSDFLTPYPLPHTPKKQRCCWITYTDDKVHEMLKTGFDRSPMFQGRIEGTGPRYCPSIEDKINRFADRDRHQLFVEPEGWNTIEIYLNGFSTSLPEEIQYKALKLIPGLENVKMFRPGYAIEYDYFPPTQLSYTLETKLIKNLFFAGQINGTTGYEEAACQGLMAGINAHQNVHEKEPFTLSRSEAYIGVLIDDLINKGTDEPYRMFTSRAEYRTLLRQDNADIRLTEMSHKIGLASDERMFHVKHKEEKVEAIKKAMKEISFEPDQINSYFDQINSSPLTEKTNSIKILLRPNVSLPEMATYSKELSTLLQDVSRETVEQVEIQLKYDSYIEKEKELVAKANSLEELIIPANFDYENLKSLSSEGKQKFMKIRPRTLGQAGRISGVNPTDVQILMVYMGR
ncbi:MAG: tRNA uridine-5-carboxymethylaminomethyl(34) synthesis enzyme MnmG [Bacteroidetes bacterium]|nr:tRNA uridine-5-carboxymethylaminomethyl(34) synthesis enzyme MnmG [Bacteroidota bacterium]MBP6314669.1 tRNA uridine-5-carboxymethylaminomethyl(34) synthesis enzyme MnmG [Chitinophagaceae bacterium]